MGICLFVLILTFGLPSSPSSRYAQYPVPKSPQSEAMKNNVKFTGKPFKRLSQSSQTRCALHHHNATETLITFYVHKGPPL